MTLSITMIYRQLIDVTNMWQNTKYPVSQTMDTQEHKLALDGFISIKTDAHIDEFDSSYFETVDGKMHYIFSASSAQIKSLQCDNKTLFYDNNTKITVQYSGHVTVTPTEHHTTACEIGEGVIEPMPGNLLKFLQNHKCKNIMMFPVQESTTIFDGIKLYEPVTYQTFKRVQNSNKIKDTAEAIQLENYIDRFNKGTVPVNYERPNKYGFNIGRVYPVKGSGLHMFRRPTRQTIFEEQLIDIDIVNAHPTIALQMISANIPNIGYQVKYLRDYVNNRDQWLTKLSIHYFANEDNKHLIKELIAKILYGGSFSTWAKENNVTTLEPTEEIKNITAEIGKIHIAIKKAHDGFYQKIKATKPKNSSGTLTAYILQEFENRILEVIYKYCAENGFIQNDICALCNDGIALEKRLYKPELLERLSYEVENQTGFKIKLINKPFNESYGETLNEHIIYKSLLKKPNDGDLSEIFTLLYGDRFICHEGKLYFYNGVRWEEKLHAESILASFLNDKLFSWLRTQIFNKQNEIENMIKKVRQLPLEESNDEEKIPEFLSEFFKNNQFSYDGRDFKKQDDNIYINRLLIMKRVACQNIDKFEAYLKNVSSREGVIKDIKRRVIITDPEFKFDAIPYLIGFNNCIYDIVQRKVVPARPEQYITKTTGWDWTAHSCPKKKNVVHALLDSIFPNPEIKRFALMCYSTMFYGVSPQKFFLLTGAGRNGKSLLTRFWGHLFGSYFLDMQAILLTKPIANDKLCPELVKLDGVRGAIAAELKYSLLFCGATIKAFTGGNNLQARTLYGEFKRISMISSLFIEINSIPHVDEWDYALRERIIRIVFERVFKNSEDWEKLTPEEKASGKFGKQDPTKDTPEFFKEHRREMTEILFEAFQDFVDAKYQIIMPPLVKNYTNQYCRSTDDYLNWVNETFEQKDGHYLTRKEFYEIYKQSPLYLNTSTRERKTITQSSFDAIINKYPELAQHFKDRDSYFTTFEGKKIKFSSKTVINIRKRDTTSTRGFFDKLFNASPDGDDDSDADDEPVRDNVIDTDLKVSTL